MKTAAKTSAFILLVVGMNVSFSLPYHPQTPQAERTARDKVTLCHKGKTIRIDESAVAAHMAHGDTMGACSE